MDKLIELINNELEQNKTVRINNIGKDTIVTSNNVEIHKELNKIIYPGFLNCTLPGTPCRVTGISYTGGFGAEGYETVEGYHINMSDEFNDHDIDYAMEEADTWYGTDKYLEDAYEASHVNDYFDEGLI